LSKHLIKYFLQLQELCTNIVEFLTKTYVQTIQIPFNVQIP